MKTAVQFLGTPYRWGGKTSFGMDCSGFIQSVFKSVGIEFPRDAYQQYDFLCESKIRMEEIQTGDLLFFSEKGKITHVAIVLSEHEFIHARGWVRKESFANNSPNYNKKLMELFHSAVSIKRFLEQ